MTRRLEQLQEQAERARAAYEAARESAAKEEKKARGRRRVVYGEALLAWAAKEPEAARQVMDRLAEFINRPADRFSVGLPPKPKATAKPPHQAQPKSAPQPKAAAAPKV